MLIFGHRGVIDRKLAQNSVKAFTVALDAADGFETDACLTADGAIALAHEANNAMSIREHLDPASAAWIGSRRLRELTAADIARLRLDDGQPIPTLRQGLELTGRRDGKFINIELKGYGVAPAVLALLRESFAAGVIEPEAVIISSFHHTALKLVRAVLPAITIGALVVSDDENGAPLYSYNPEAEARIATYVGLTEALRSPLLLNEVKPDLLVMPEKLLQPSTADKIGAAFPQAKLAGWTVTERDDYDQEDLLRRLAALRPGGKVAAMIVDRPVEFVRALRHG